jgi:hypothetical protein
MRTPMFLIAALGGLLLLPLAVMAQEDSEVMKTDWMELVKGYKGKTMGAEVREIEPGEEEGSRKITLAIPKSAVRDPDEIEEVVVVGRKPEEPEPLLDVRMEWLDDYDNDNYGLIIYLRKDSNWPIRVYMSSEEGYIR